MNRMNRCGRKWISILCLAFVILTCGGCGNKGPEEGDIYTIYHLNHDQTGLVMQDYTTQTPQDDKDTLLEELTDALSQTPDKLEYYPPLSGRVHLLDYHTEKDQVTLEFDSQYKELPATTEILVRAAVVRTLTQVEGISYVSFTVQGEPLVDNLGNVVGIMSADQFIDNSGDEINTYEQAELRLYFADETGTHLVEANRTLRFSSNIAMEKLVVEQLIKGPENPELYPTINPETKIVNVTVKDGICYVNLSEAFLTQTYQVTPEISVYSLVNSLVELPNVNKVQISVNGETAVTYQESISLTTVFERNLDLLNSGKEE